MFDKTFIGFGQTRTDTEYVPFVKEVHEFRAPTDKSVELLKEMEEAALNKFLGTYKIQNNLFKVDFFVFTGVFDFSYDIGCRYALNGENKSFKFIVQYNENFETSFDIFVERLMEKFREEMVKIFTIEFGKSGVFQKARMNGISY